MSDSADSFQVTQVALTGSLTLLPCPTTIESGEVWLTSSTAFNFSDSSSGVAFPCAANAIVCLPILAAKASGSRQGIYVSGSGNLQASFFGWVAPK